MKHRCDDAKCHYEYPSECPQSEWNHVLQAQVQGPKCLWEKIEAVNRENIVLQNRLTEIESQLEADYDTTRI